MMDRATQTGTMVYVDDSFASVDDLRKAIRAAEQGQAEVAITKFQEISDNYNQKLVYLDDNSYEAIPDYVRENLLNIPEVRSGMYDQLFGTTAKKEIDAATENHDLAMLIRMCDRYYPATAALQGLARAGDWYFERGEFTAAARTWQELLDHPMAREMRPVLLFRAAMADGLSGNKAGAQALRDRLAKDFADATGTVSGKETTLLAKLDEILAAPAWDKVELAPDDWPAFGGGPNHPGLLKTSATIGAQLWSVSGGNSPATAVSGSSIDINNNGVVFLAGGGIARLGGNVITQSTNSDGILASFPVVADGTLFVHMGDRIAALSANAGTELWSFPPPPTRVVDAQGAVRRNILPGPNVATVYGDQVFALLPGGDPGMGGSSSVYLGGSTQVVCMSRDTGKEIWHFSGGEIPTNRGGPITFVGSPIVSRQGVFILGRKASEQGFIQNFIVRLDRLRGELQWNCYLCSASTSRGYSSAVILPTISDDVLYLSTGLGADCAVDANVGHILWLRITAAPRAANAPFQPAGTAIVSIPWKLNPPLVTQDRVIVADGSQGLFVYNRSDGTPVNHVIAADLSLSSIDVVAGIVDGKLIVTGMTAGAPTCRTLALDVDALSTPGSPTADDPRIKTIWSAEISPTANGTGPLHGRPFLTQTGYYLPFGARLVRVDTHTGAVDAPLEWPHDENNEPGKPGNLLVTTEQVVVSSEEGVSGYSRWETALANRNARITAHPNEPAPYLDLAEISFRTNHEDLAESSMKKAVDLAVSDAAGSAGGSAAASIIRRIYQTNFTFAEQLLPKPDDTQRDLARFYYDNCRATAREPAQQAQWRLRLAELSQKQKNMDEAAKLYNEVLTDPTLRSAHYEQSDTGQSAGGTAELKMAAIKRDTPQAYKRFEDQAAALTDRAVKARDTAGLQQVVDGYPNADAARTAADTLATLYLQKQDWDNALRALRWLEPLMTTDQERARIISEMVNAYVGLKKYGSAYEWASHGVRRHPEYTWKADDGKAMTFASQRDQIVHASGTDIVGRLPAWSGQTSHEVSATETPIGESNLLAGNAQLLAPLETALPLRQPNLVFLRTDDRVRIYDTAKRANLAEDIRLPQHEDAVLLGSTAETAVLLQRNNAIGIDLKTKHTWVHPLPGNGTPRVADAVAAPNGQAANIRRLIPVTGPGDYQVIGDHVIVQGGMYPIESVTLIDRSTGQLISLTASADAESDFRGTLAMLGQPMGFSSAHLVDGKLVLLVANHVEAVDMEDGSPAWRDSAGQAINGKLPDGNPQTVFGNQDLVVAQVDSAGGAGAASSMLVGFDAGTGRPRGTVKVEEGPVLWRALGDDSTLFIQTPKYIAAFDFTTGAQRWKRNIGSRYAGATTLTLSGLVCFDDNNSPQCLSPDNGQPRWPDNLNSKNFSAATVHAMRAFPDGDNLFLQSGDMTSVIPMIGGKTGISDLTAPFSNGGMPPLLGAQLSNLCLVQLASAPVGTDRVAGAMLVFHDRVNWKLVGAVRLHQGSDDAGGTIPFIRSWQVVDGGIVLDVAPRSGSNTPGMVYFWPYGGK